MSGPFADQVRFYRDQLQDSDDRFAKLVELLGVVDVSVLPDDEKLKHVWYIQLVASHMVHGLDLDNGFYG